MTEGIFAIRARRCKRCGRILTNAEAVERGYGCRCAAHTKAEKEAAEPIPGQVHIMDLLKEMEE